ncbi:hypothetical protein BASA81_008403 [Batrachochytrium salamandrivorans]|nr:hypothetical protein BASA81_008403 [Batrachochytrium salamandrivorans]
MAPRLSSSPLSLPSKLGGGYHPVRAPVAQPRRLFKAQEGDEDEELCHLFPSNEQVEEDHKLRPENPMAKVLNDQQEALLYSK